MSCYGCGTTFGIFKKEFGCNHCGFYFCGKCCSKKIIIPKIDSSKKQLVCKTCFEALSSVHTTEKDVKMDSPPQALKKRMEALHNKSSISGNMNEKDKIISEKLKKLKPQRSLDPVISQTELEERLAKLKGINPKVYTAPPILVYREQDNRSAVEKTEHLLQQYQHEVELESKEKSTVKEIEERLAKLRDENIEKPSLPDVLPEHLISKEEGKELSIGEIQNYLAEQTAAAELVAKKEVTELESDKELQNQLMKLKKKKDKENIPNCEEENDEVAANELVKKFVAEAALDEACYDEKSHVSSDSENEKDDDLPWCVICMANAQLRCFGCERDLFCLRCFKECHESFELTDHPTEPFQPIKQTTKSEI